MASSNDLIKYFTEEVVRYLDTPKQERQRKVKEPVTYKWFGFIPLALQMMIAQLKIHFVIFSRITFNIVRKIVKKTSSFEFSNKK